MSKERFDGIVVAIAIPAMDHVHTNFAYDLCKMATSTAYEHPELKQHLVICKASLIPKQREQLVDNVLETDATHLLFLDSDMRFPKDTMVRLLRHKVEAVCASYIERNPPHRPVAFLDPTNWEKRAWPTEDTHGLLNIAACGTGLMLLETEMLRQLKKPRFMVGYNTTMNTYMGEDVYFCQKLMENQTPLWLDQDLTKEVAHIAQLELRPMEALAYAKAHGTLPEYELSVEGIEAAKDYQPVDSMAVVEGA